MNLPGKRNRWIPFGVALVVAGGVAVLFRRDAPFVPIQRSVQFLPADSRIPAQPVSLFERWVPMRLSWLWRMRDKIRGPLDTILISSTIVDCSEVGTREWSELLPDDAMAGTNGLRAWILDDASIERLRRQFTASRESKVLASPRVQTAHGIQSSMSVSSSIAGANGPVQVGLTMDTLPLIQADGTDLTSLFTLTAAVTNGPAQPAAGQSSTSEEAVGTISVRTNFAGAVRWNLPDGFGCFLLGPPVANNTPRIGVLISTTVKRAKR